MRLKAEDPRRDEPAEEKEWRCLRGPSNRTEAKKGSGHERSSSEPALCWEFVGLRLAANRRNEWEG